MPPTELVKSSPPLTHVNSGYLWSARRFNHPGAHAVGLRLMLFGGSFELKHGLKQNNRRVGSLNTLCWEVQPTCGQPKLDFSDAGMKIRGPMSDFKSGRGE